MVANEGKGFLEKLVEKGAEAAVRVALGYKDAVRLVEDYPQLVEAVIEVSRRIASFDGVSFRCELCGKGPFTRKGLYLHIKRVHMNQVKELILKRVRSIMLEGSEVRRGGARS